MGQPTRKILVIDDEVDILHLLKYNLSKEGFDVKTASNGKKGVEIAKEFAPDLILLDIMMPSQDGVETCRQIRELPKLNGSYIIFLTARSEEYSEVAAFDAGADDYIIKPIKPRALLSRINAFFRKDSKKGKENQQVKAGKLLIDRRSFTVKLDEKIVNLPKKEFELLFHLAQNPGKVFSRDDLLQSIWGTDVFVLARTVDVHVRKVREKIGEKFITTVRGVGYKFEVIDAT